MRFLCCLANRSTKSSMFRAFALFYSVLRTPRLLSLSSLIVDLRHVFTRFSVEKLCSHEAELTGIAAAILQSLKSSKNTSLFGSMNCTSSTVLEGVCIPVFIFLSKIRLNWCSSCPKSFISESYNPANDNRGVSSECYSLSHSLSSKTICQAHWAFHQRQGRKSLYERGLYLVLTHSDQQKKKFTAISLLCFLFRTFSSVAFVFTALSLSLQVIIACLCRSDFECTANPPSLYIAFFQFLNPPGESKTVSWLLGELKCLQA